jgi:hypothetical protein
MEKIKKKKMLRLNYFILPAFQFKMIAVSLGMSLIQLSGLYILINRFEAMLASKLSAAGIPATDALFIFIERQGHQLEQSTLYLGLGLLVFNFICFTAITQRIAAPLYRIKIASIAWRTSDEPLDLKLRKGDFFQDIASELQSLNEQFIKKEVPAKEIMNEKKAS